MKRILIDYDETTCNMGVRAEGFTDAEVIVVLREAQKKAEEAVIENLKKKKVSLVSSLGINLPRI